MQLGAALLLSFAFIWFHLQTRCKSQANVPSSRNQEFMFIPSNHDFYIVLLFPIHQPDQSFFGCGPANNSQVLYELSAIINNVNKTNEAALLRTGVSLGLLIIDYCDRTVRAIDQLYRLLSNDSSFPISANSVVSVITVTKEVMRAVEPITNPMLITHMFSPLKPELGDSVTTNTKSAVLQTVVSNSEWMKALGDFLRAAEIKLMSVIYSNNEFGNNAVTQVKQIATDICVLGSVAVSHIRDIISAPRRLLNVRGQVTLVFVDDPELFESLLESDTDSDAIYVVNDEILSNGMVTNTSVNVLAIGLGEWTISDGLEDYLHGVKPNVSNGIPRSWMLELWQNEFKCSLPGDVSTMYKYPRCKGNEELNNTQASNPALHRLDLAVKTISVGFQNFLTRHCPQYDKVQTLPNCGADSRSNLLREIQKSLIGDNEKGQTPFLSNAEGTTDLLFVYYARQFYGEKIIPNKLGIWRNRFISLISGLPAAFQKNGPAVSLCVGVCARVCPQQAASFIPGSVDPAINFLSTWGIVMSTLSAIGMLGVVACFAYFIVVVPTSKGTALLDYIILIGIFFEYGINYAFIAAATDATCVLKRLLMGVAYAIVFSAKLVKVVNTWRVTRTGPRPSSVASSIVSSKWQIHPSFALLISISLAAFQAAIAIAWLILRPSMALRYKSTSICSPGLDFEEGLVLSFLYVIVLMLCVLGFSFATRKIETNNQESRWIFLSTSLNILLWIIWIVVAIVGEVDQRNVAITIGNLLCASITLTCLYLPKIYLYSSLLKQAKKLDIRAFYPQTKSAKRRQQAVTCLYDPLAYRSITSSCTSVNGSFGGTTTNHKQGLKKEVAENNVSKHQSPRYPRLVYDNRSQFHVEKFPKVNGNNTHISSKHNGFSAMNKTTSSRNNNDKIDYF